MKNNVKMKCMQEIRTQDLSIYGNCIKYKEQEYREEFNFYELRFFK